MTRFRPCIDLHLGKVKQIVGGTLTANQEKLQTNFVSEHSANHYAGLYRRDGLPGGHLIQLGPGNREAALGALEAYPGGLQLGGGVRLENAVEWLERGASHVIVTSYLFDAEGFFQWESLEALSREVGRDRLVVDLSCRAEKEGGWRVAMNRWQSPTDLTLEKESLQAIAAWCSEFLVHAADVEGKCEGIDSELVVFLGAESPLPVTYAGGAMSTADLATVNRLSGGRVDLTIGSALDIFGGSGASYADCLAWNKKAK